MLEIKIANPFKIFFGWCVKNNIPVKEDSSVKITHPKIIELEFRWYTVDYWNAVKSTGELDTKKITEGELRLLENTLEKNLFPKLNFLIFNKNLSEIILGYDPMTMENYQKIKFVGQLTEDWGSTNVQINYQTYEKNI